MASITSEHFGAQLQQQVVQQNKEAMMWHELQVGTIYTIVGTKLINAKNGEACVLFLSDGTTVFSPCALIESSSGRK